ncbi:putative DNA repair protein [Streptomyces venezuelae]|uniref:Ku protein n=1 Tax=Streptomyces gardneri TaxID=66892 RepID=UPI0006BC7011|nr:Ku protein [Streptomyces gardneri]ALO13615.1 putative DNA repair protein [Streptomyces venezuelae]QPK50203.1 hypothetical protein H4W23_40280 [Streptomyces gardneri]WRK41809.1 hypothetical protein U0M97_40530 [Streptomyces venezuelae]CUM35612.1 Ku domain protein [Streptomyces venezuelae]
MRSTGRCCARDEIGKGYEVSKDSKDSIIPITDQDLADMPLPTAKAIEIITFVDREARGFPES